MTVTAIRTVLGESRPVTRVYDDGSVDCPFCSQPIIVPATECSNPWCDALPTWQPEALRARLAERHAREQEEAQRRANHASAMRRIQEDQAAEQAWADEQTAEAIRSGTCRACLFASGYRRAKFIKHRGACPRQRNA